MPDNRVIEEVLPVLGTCENPRHDPKPQEWHEHNAMCIDWHPGADRMVDEFYAWDHPPVWDSLCGDPVVIIATSDFNRLCGEARQVTALVERLQYALEKACEDGWSDGAGAMIHYMIDATEWQERQKETPLAHSGTVDEKVHGSYLDGIR